MNPVRLSAYQPQPPPQPPYPQPPQTFTHCCAQP